MSALLKKRCYDDATNPEDTWVRDYRLSKNVSIEPRIKARYKWAWELQGDILNPEWCHKRLIWTDICNSIFPKIENMHKKHAMARKGRKGWGSKRTKQRSRNLKGDTTLQNSIIEIRARGRLRTWFHCRNSSSNEIVFVLRGP